jgi:hypothetical protein
MSGDERGVRVPIGLRTWPAVLAAIGAMLGPFAVSMSLAPAHLTVPWLAVPIVVGAVLPLPVAALVAAVTSRGEVVVADGVLRWTLDERAGRIDLRAPFVVEAWLDARVGDADAVWVTLGVTQGDEAVAVAYTVHPAHAPELPRRDGPGPVFLIASWRARPSWEALRDVLRASPGAVSAA